MPRRLRATSIRRTPARRPRTSRSSRSRGAATLWRSPTPPPPYTTTCRRPLRPRGMCTSRSRSVTCSSSSPGATRFRRRCRHCTTAMRRFRPGRCPCSSSRSMRVSLPMSRTACFCPRRAVHAKSSSRPTSLKRVSRLTASSTSLIQALPKSSSSTGRRGWTCSPWCPRRRRRSTSAPAAQDARRRASASVCSLRRNSPHCRAGRRRSWCGAISRRTCCSSRRWGSTTSRASTLCRPHRAPRPCRAPSPTWRRSRRSMTTDDCCRSVSAWPRHHSTR